MRAGRSTAAASVRSRPRTRVEDLIVHVDRPGRGRPAREPEQAHRPGGAQAEGGHDRLVVEPAGELDPIAGALELLEQFTRAAGGRHPLPVRGLTERLPPGKGEVRLRLSPIESAAQGRGREGAERAAGGLVRPHEPVRVDSGLEGGLGDDDGARLVEQAREGELGRHLRPLVQLGLEDGARVEDAPVQSIQPPGVPDEQSRDHCEGRDDDERDLRGSHRPPPMSRPNRPGRRPGAESAAPPWTISYTSRIRRETSLQSKRPTAAVAWARILPVRSGSSRAPTTTRARSPESPIANRSPEAPSSRTARKAASPEATTWLPALIASTST